MGKKVKCSDCGFLAMRRRDDLTLVEADREFRTTGRAEKGPKFIQERPICFAMKTNFIEELSDQINPDPPKVKAGIQGERECDGFTEWQLGFTPKEHKEMLDEKWKLAFQAEQEEKVRAHQERMLQQQQEHQETMADAQRDWQKQQSTGLFTKQVIVFGLGVTGALIFGQIAAALIQRGTWF